MKKYNNQDGRSMIEMLGVLAIVGVLSVAGIAGYSKAMGKYKASKAMDQVSTISANVKTMFANMGTYSVLDNEKAVKLSLLPEEMTKTCHGASGTGATAVTANYDDCVINALNGTTTLSGANGTSFTIAMASLPQDACVALATSEWGGSSGFKGLKVGSTLVDTFALAASNCEGGNKTITWEFY